MSSVCTARLSRTGPGILTTLALTTALLALSACSGGDSESAPPPPPPPPASGTLTLTGVVARGAAIANAAVAVTCQTGTGTATSAANGSFTVTITSGALPCVAKATGTDGTVLNSVAQGSGSSATVNISPLTELVVAQAIGAPASTLFANFNAAAQARVSATALTQATGVVATALQSVVSLTGVDPFKDTLVAGSGTGLDGKLDQLGAALTAARLSLDGLSAVIVANGAASGPVVAQVTQPAAASCASYRSGSYAVLSPGEAEVAARVTLVGLNATTGAVTVGGSTVSTLTPVAGKPCEYTDGTATTVVSASGLAVSSEPSALSLAVPLQALSVADLAGTWNFQEFGNDTPNGAYANFGGLLNFNATGNLSYQDCDYLSPCGPSNAVPGAVTVNAAGGFDLIASGIRLRLFAFRAASGQLSLFILDDSYNNLIVATRQVAVGLPVVGQATTFWDLTVSSGGVVSPFSTATVTVTAVDAAAGSFTRRRSSDGRIDSFTINQPRSGLRSRVLNSCTNASGAALNCAGIITMPLPGTGVTVYGSSSGRGTDFFGISVNQP